jgi:MFS superfamily sulfate permease-like transporter
VLGRVDGVDGYHDVQRHPEAWRIDGLVLLRWDAPLFFANAEWFERVVRDTIAASPTPVAWLVVAAEPVTSIDVTAADVLRELDQSLQDQGIELCFAEMKGPVKDKLKRFGLFSRFGQQTFFATIDDPVRGYLAAHPAKA